MSISLNDLANRLENVEHYKGFEKHVVDNGWWFSDATSGLVVQFGVFNKTSANVTINLYKNFSNTKYYAIGTLNSTSSTNNSSFVGSIKKTTSSFIVRGVYESNGSCNGEFAWLAIGYLVSNRVNCLFKEVISYVNLLK